MGYKRATAEQYSFPQRKAHKEDQVVGFMGGGWAGPMQRRRNGEEFGQTTLER